MIHYLKSFSDQINLLLDTYPGLHITESTENLTRLSGRINIYRTGYGYTLDKDYLVEIVVPVRSDFLPCIFDSGNAIDKNYIHRYTDGRLCLETDTRIRLFFIDGFDLCKWMTDFVEPYFFSYEYYTRYGQFPFGERPHGFLGIVNTYQELLNGIDEIETIKLIRFASSQKYRGHAPCPCGSNKHFRNCHGKYLYRFMTNPRYKEIIVEDWKNIQEEAAATHDKARKNTGKAK